MSIKAIALIDCNSFYCSCERLFRPDLKNKPVIVLSNNDGCVISRTDEAKALGIKMGEPYFKIKDLCLEKGVHVFSTNFALYTNLSDRVMKTLVKLTPEVEVYSVDEAFCDLSGIENLSAFGRNIRETLSRNVGIPVGVGIAPTKVLSKIANRLAKKSKKANGVVNLMEKKYQDIGLSRVEIEDVWGIGRASAIKMRSLGIKTAKDLRDFKNDKLIQSIFTKVGLSIKHELMGINCFEFNRPTPPKKEIMCSRTFGGVVRDLKDLKESIANYVTDAAEKLRAQGSQCQEIAVFARTNPFNDSTQFYLYEVKSLVTPTSNTMKLIKHAYELLERGYRSGYEYKKAGVRLSDFYSSYHYQLDLLKQADQPHEIKLMKTIDQINAREGETVVKSLACGINDKAVAMNRNFKSPRFTTSWGELKIFE